MTEINKSEIINGRLVHTHTEMVDFSKVLSDDPIAFTMGRIDGQLGIKRGIPKRELAKEYLRGYKLGKANPK